MNKLFHNSLNLKKHFYLKPERQIKERRQSNSPPTVSSSNPTQQVSSFVQNHSRQSSDQLKRYTPNAPSSSTNQAQVTSNTYLNVLSPIFSNLALKYRNSSLTSQVNSNSIDTPKLDDLKNSFLNLEQQHPGSSDLFIKNIFSLLKPTSLNAHNEFMSSSSGHSSNNF